MKKLVGLFVGLFLVTMVAGNVNATVFQIGSNGSLDLPIVNFTLGDYTANSWGPVDLVEGQTSADIEFFSIDWFVGAGAGTLTANIDFTDPTGPQQDQGSTIFASILVGSTIDITWGDPLQFSYGNGGLFTLDLFDVDLLQFGSAFSISGNITNDRDPVPEPATMLLFGLGLLGLAGVSRKKR